MLLVPLKTKGLMGDWIKLTIEVSENSSMGKFIAKHVSSNKKYDDWQIFFKEHMGTWDDNVARCLVVGCKATHTDDSPTRDDMCEVCGDFVDSCGGCE